MHTATPKRSGRIVQPPPVEAAAGTRTLCIDIGGTGVKALVVAPDGRPTTERVRLETPRPATPKAVLRVIHQLIEQLGAFDRVSVGFPGVVEDGVVKTAVNLHPAWKGFALAQVLSESTRRPVRVLNDAGVQGFGVIEGRGVELVLTLGTGMGCALYTDGHYVPNLELAHHPFRNGKTYEDYVGAAALERVGKKRWNKHVERVLEQVQPIFNPRRIYLGGGNAKHLTLALPRNVTLVANISGLLGGLALWRDVEPAGPGESPPKAKRSRRSRPGSRRP